MRWWMAGVMAAASTGALWGQAVTPQPGRTIVFFDWAKPDLNREATAALDEVAAAYRQSPGQLRIMGHTDRSGSAAVNQRSGLVRARSVSAYLAEQGVPRGAMTVESHGEERPLVPTEDGVREVQNRRVEINFGSRSAE